MGFSRWVVALLLFAAVGLVLLAAWDLGAAAREREPLFPRALLPALGVLVALATIGVLLRPGREDGAGAADLRSLLHWLVRLRWIAVAAVFASVAFASHGLGLVEHPVPLYVIAAVVGASNLVFRAWVGRATPPRTQGLTQILADLVALTALLVLSGGVENPFAAFYVFHVILASILLPARDAFAVASASFLLYGGMTLADHFGLLVALGPGPTELALGRPLRLAGAPSVLAGLLAGFGATVFVAAYLCSSIAERLRTKQAELSSEKEKVEDIVRGIGAGMILIDSEKRVRWENERAREWFGPSLGKPCYQALWGLGEPCKECPSSRVWQAGGRVHAEVSRTVAGRRAHFLVTSSVLHDPDGRPDQVVELIQDITERKEMEAQLVQAGKMVAVGELASGIAHEINNPLASVSAIAELLEDLVSRGEFERFPKHVARIREQVERCKEIVRSLLNFARHGDDEVGELDVPFVVEDTLRLIRQAALAQGKEIHVDVEEGLPRARMNGAHLQQVIMNLLTNALDAIAGKGRIDVVARGEGADEGRGAAVRIEVRDTGCGIPEADLPRLFDPFFTTKPPGKGTGLGLALCARLLERAGGSIGVSSRVGQGSTFTVRLPAVRQQAGLASSERGST